MTSSENYCTIAQDAKSSSVSSERNMLGLLSSEKKLILQCLPKKKIWTILMLDKNGVREKKNTDPKFASVQNICCTV